MPGAWELVVTWHGEPVRAELLQGKVKVSAAGPRTSDLPLPLADPQTLLRGNAVALDLLPVAGATWCIDGQPAAGMARLAPDQGAARLELGSLEVAVQGTGAPPPFPRFVAADAALLRVAVHLAATALVGLTLFTEPIDERPSFVHGPAPATVAATEVPRRSVPSALASLPWLAAERPDSAVPPPRRAPSRRPTAVARSVAPALPDAGDALPPLAAPVPWPPELDVEPGVDPIAVLAAPAGGGRTNVLGAAGGRGRGGAGGLGSCVGPTFESLARRYGRDVAIVACSPGVQFERPPSTPGADDVVFRETAHTPLAPEVWTWGHPHGR